MISVKKTLVYFVNEKSEGSMFKRFKALVEKEMGYYIKALRSYRGEVNSLQMNAKLFA